jgi:putative FmdB family regulatory protein
MPLYDYRCPACGATTEVLQPRPGTYDVTCGCGCAMVQLIGAPQFFVVKGNDVDPNPVERAKREADMQIVVPRRRYLNQWRRSRRVTA